MALSLVFNVFMLFLLTTFGYKPKEQPNFYTGFIDVPSKLPYGLLSKVNITNLVLVNGSCIAYDKLGETFCKYYSDCCAMTPVRVEEQLPAGTFSCHNGYYVIDKCPVTTTDKKLEELCEQDDGQLTGLFILIKYYNY